MLRDRLPAIAVALSLVMLSGGASPALSKGVKKAATGAGKDDPGCRGAVSQAASLFANNKASQAAELLSEWSPRCPGNAQLHLLLSSVLVRLGNRGTEAEKAAAQAVAVAPTLVAAHLQYALVLMGNGKEARASQEFERIIELEPGNYEAWSSLADLYSRLHEDEKAAKCAQKAADLEPGTRTVRLRMLKNLKASGKTDAARAEIRRLINNTEFGPEFMQDLAGEALSIGAYDEAITAGAKVLEAYPRSSAPLKIMAIARLSKHDYEGCLDTARKLSAIAPGSTDAKSLEGVALARMGRLDEAEKELQAVLSKQPEQALARMGLGTVQFARGDFRAASENLQQSVDADPLLSRDAEVCYTLAQALEKQGEREFAVTYYKRSLANGLSGDSAAGARESLNRLQGSEGAPP